MRIKHVVAVRHPAANNRFFKAYSRLASAIGYEGRLVPKPTEKASKKAAPVKAEPAPEPKREAPPAETESEESERMIDVAALPIWSTLQIFLGILDRVAWLRMGLVVNPATQKIEKDFEQAKAAIDCYESILKTLGSKLQADAKRQFDARLTDLKLNYASHK